MRIPGKKLLDKAVLLHIDGEKQKILEGYPAMLKAWALKNTKAKTKTYIAFKDDQKVFVIYEGRVNNLPETTEPKEDIYISI